MNFKFLDKNNSHLIGKTMKEIMALDYTIAINGLREGVSHYNRETGVKEITDYYYKEDVVIRKQFKDVFDNDGNFIALEITHNWIPTTGQWAVKKELKSNKKTLLEVQISRRNNIKTDIISEANKSDNPIIKIVYSHIFNYLQLGLNTWVNTGDVSLFNNLLDTAPTVDNSQIMSVFGGQDNTPKSINDLLNLFSAKQHDTEERNLYVHEYLKYFIK